MTKSKQNQYVSNNTRTALIKGLYKMISDIQTPLSPYTRDTRRRDSDLLAFSRSEPLLSGVLSSVVQRDINRSWMLTGAMSKVIRTARNLHSVNDGRGWRNFISKLSTSYYSTNFGFAGEIGTDTKGKPVTMWSFDPTTLYFEDNTRLKYTVNNTILKKNEYFHANSMPSVEEELMGAGFCAVERALILVRIAIGLFQHQLEKLGVAPPKGLALFKGMEKDSYSQAIADAEEEMTNEEIVFYRNVIALFSDNTEVGVDLIGFSQLPDNFQLKEFIDIIMQAYSLAFGYPVSEVWSISSGSFSRDGEMQVQQSQATEKGELAFALALQEQLLETFIPSSVTFSFDLRNDAGDLTKAELDEKRIKSIVQLYSAGRISKESDEPLISREQALQLLSQYELVPNDWIENGENKVTEDIRYLRESARVNPYIVSRAMDFPDEPIIYYSFSPLDLAINGVSVDSDALELSKRLVQMQPEIGKYGILYKSGEEMLRKINY